jgi:hypothetical protein
MPSLDRSATTKLLYKRLLDPKFRKLVKAADADGAKPLIVALPSDPISYLLDQLRMHDWTGNVVVPALNGFVLFAFDFASGPYRHQDDRAVESPIALRSDCTVGVFLQRLELDLVARRRVAYQLEVELPGQQREGRAELIGLAG